MVLLLAFPASSKTTFARSHVLSWSKNKQFAFPLHILCYLSAPLIAVSMWKALHPIVHFSNLVLLLGHPVLELSAEDIRLSTPTRAPETPFANFCLHTYHILLQFHLPIYLFPFPGSELPEGKHCLICPLPRPSHFSQHIYCTALGKSRRLGSTFSFSDFCLRGFSSMSRLMKMWH